MKIHFIAIGGSAMHNLALALLQAGHTISGSDDEINEPSRTRLENAGLLPEQMGWFPERIHGGLDAVILGMHARSDNPELLRAAELQLKVYSYPEYLYEFSKNKTRIVIAGSHGKTSITAMVLHALKYAQKDFDYMVGAQLEGFDTMVKLSDESDLIVLEGDEYLASPIDRRSKFHLYKADIALVSGIAWDHINVFPTFESYIDTFKVFIQNLPPTGALVYCREDAILRQLAAQTPDTLRKLAYSIPPHIIRNGQTILLSEAGEVPLRIFGKHNLMNLEGARYISSLCGVTTEEFYTAIRDFNGASRRLQKIAEDEKGMVFFDFAHSPSKLQATLAAVREQFPDHYLIACMELHTFSSLNPDFLSEYRGCMDLADEAWVYYNAHTLAIKKLPPLSEHTVREAFGREDIGVVTDSKALMESIRASDARPKVWLMMSSGNFDKLALKEILQ